MFHDNTICTAFYKNLKHVWAKRKHIDLLKGAREAMFVTEAYWKLSDCDLHIVRDQEP